MDWKKHLEKNRIQKVEKTVNIKVKLPHVNKKPLVRKRTLFKHPFLFLLYKTTRVLGQNPVSA